MFSTPIVNVSTTKYSTTTSSEKDLHLFNRCINIGTYKLNGATSWKKAGKDIKNGVSRMVIKITNEQDELLVAATIGDRHYDILLKIVESMAIAKPNLEMPK